MNNQRDDDPFDGYGLSSQLKASRQEAAAAVQTAVPVPEPAHAPPPPRFELPPPAAFEVRARRGTVRCDDCFHYVPGGQLSIDHIYEAEPADLFELIRESKEFEKSFEVRELREIVEKAKTLDETFDARPRIRGYCRAGKIDSDSLNFIAEIKNRDGNCDEFLPGRAPLVHCSDCAHCRKAIVEKPFLSDRQIDYGDRSIGFDYGDGGYFRALSNQFDRRESDFRRDEEEYREKLENDIRDSIFYDRSPDNSTIDWCELAPFRACGVANRGLRCTDFQSHQQKRQEEFNKTFWKTDPFKRPEPFDRKGKNLRKHTEVMLQNPEYMAESTRASKARRDRIGQDQSKPLTEEQQRIPCFNCVHRRDPVQIDPFETVHFNTTDIMAVRDEYRQEKARRNLEERRICGLPGASLGDAEVPSLHIWCDLYSRRQADDKIQEYAYCYRALKASAPDGNCPGFRAKD